MSNKSSIEWLVNELNQKIDFIPMDKWDKIRDIVQQAKEMHKQEIKNAFRNGDSNGTFETINAEQYYKETFCER